MHACCYSNRTAEYAPARQSCSDPYNCPLTAPRRLGLRIERCTPVNLRNRQNLPVLLRNRFQVQLTAPALQEKDSDRLGASDSSRVAENSQDLHTEKAQSTKLDSPDATAADTVSLLCVSLLWSTYSPALRYLFSLPGPPTPAALTSIRAVLQAACLLPIVIVQGGAWAKHESSADDVDCDDSESNRETDLGTQPQFWRAAAELGLLNFCGTALQTIGLQQTTATRGAFLTHTTALFTPLIDGLAGGVIPLTVWAGSALGLAGTVLFSVPQHGVDTSQLHAVAPSTFLLTGGDTAVVGAALCYSLTTVRIGFHALRLAPLQLALAKSTGLAILAVGWGVSACVTARQQGQPLLSLWPGIATPQTWVVILVVAASGAAAAALQSRGQSRISASRAQVLFSFTPLWSTIIAIAVLHEEQPSGLEYLGGALIVAASILASR